jgi:hypothetical protein
MGNKARPNEIPSPSGAQYWFCNPFFTHITPRWGLKRARFGIITHILHLWCVFNRCRRFLFTTFLIALGGKIHHYKTAFNAKAKCVICSIVCFAVTIMRKHSSPRETVGKFMG